MKCEKTGEENRFGEMKELICIAYAETEHCQKYNPEAKIVDNWCSVCKKCWYSSTRYGDEYALPYPTTL